MEIIDNNPEINLQKAFKKIFLFEVKKQIIIDVVCEFYGVIFEDIRKYSRKREDVFPRQVIIYFLKEVFPKHQTPSSIGNFFLGKTGSGLHRSTIIFAINDIKGKIEVDKNFKDEILEITKKIIYTIDNYGEVK